VSPTERVAIHYRRLPDHLRIYDQRVVAERDEVVVTLSEPLELDAPMTVEDRILLEDGSLAVWFTFPGAWHDIGRFHTADGSFTGLYANVITPPVMDGPVWHTTDLFLDVWWPRGGSPKLLDEDELEEAMARGHIDDATASRARTEAARLLERAREGGWPPAVVERWTLERALDAVDG
jgi:predicted RNA-binding protein associated with RNAse of E/G family